VLGRVMVHLLLLMRLLVLRSCVRMDRRRVHVPVMQDRVCVFT